MMADLEKFSESGVIQGRLLDQQELWTNQMQQLTSIAHTVSYSTSFRPHPESCSLDHNLTPFSFSGEL